MGSSFTIDKDVNFDQLSSLLTQNIPIYALGLS